jgi:hypothetical protein
MGTRLAGGEANNASKVTATKTTRGGHMTREPEGEPRPGQPGSWPHPPASPENAPNWSSHGADWPTYPGMGGPGASPGGYGLPGGPPGPGGPQGPGGPAAPGGPPPWGAPPQQQFFDPRPRRRNGGLIAAAIAGVVVIAVAVVVVISVAGKGGDPKQTSGAAAKAAGQSIGQAGALAYVGTYGGGRAEFNVTRAGTARGSYQVGGSPVSRVDVDGVTYIKAPGSYWSSRGQAGEKADKANNRWSKNPSFSLDINLANLSPSRVSQTLQQAGNDPLAEQTSINGNNAIKMSAGGVTYYISTDKPNHLLRVEGNAGSHDYSLDVAPMSPTQSNAFFAALRGDVRDLRDAYDPSVTVLTGGGLKFGSCSEAGCTVRADATPSMLSGEGHIRITMNARFHGTGRTVSTCSGTGTTIKRHTTSISCRTSGPAWSSWYGSQTGRFTVHASATFEATVNSAADINRLLGMISQEQQNG